MNLTSSQEDYLEAIYAQVLKEGCARVSEIAAVLNVKKASVTGALNLLLKKNLINYTPYSTITLTPEGTKKAKQITKKHLIMTNFFKNILHLDEKESIENACKMEHIMTEKMFKHMTKFSSYIQDLCVKNPDITKEIEQLY